MCVMLKMCPSKIIKKPHSLSTYWVSALARHCFLYDGEKMSNMHQRETFRPSGGALKNEKLHYLFEPGECFVILTGGYVYQF